MSVIDYEDPRLVLISDTDNAEPTIHDKDCVVRDTDTIFQAEAILTEVTDCAVRDTDTIFQAEAILMEVTDCAVRDTDTIFQAKAILTEVTDCAARDTDTIFQAEAISTEVTDCAVRDTDTIFQAEAISTEVTDCAVRDTDTIFQAEAILTEVTDAKTDEIINIKRSACFTKSISNPLECLNERRRLSEYYEIIRSGQDVSSYDFSLPTVTPVILNVVASASFDAKLDLKKVLMKCPNVEYNPRRFAPCVMRIRKPKSTCLIFSTGRLIVSGCKSENECYIAVRRYARILQKYVDPTIRNIKSYDVQNMSASCTLPFRLDLRKIATNWNQCKQFISFEPELFPGLVWRLVEPKARVVLFCGGAILFTGLKSEAELQCAMKIMYPICRSCRRY